MAAVTFVFSVRDSSASPPGTRMTGLTPTWVQLKKLSDNTSATQPSFTEIGEGQYKTVYDPAANGEAAGQIDAGSTLAYPSDRFLDVVFTDDTTGNAIAASVTAGVALTASGLDAITVEAGINARQALSPILAASVGVLTGAATTTIAVAAAGNPATNRIMAIVDDNGDRTAVTLTLPT